jgi:hypothetical protein
VGLGVLQLLRMSEIYYQILVLLTCATSAPTIGGRTIGRLILPMPHLHLQLQPNAIETYLSLNRGGIGASSLLVLAESGDSGTGFGHGNRAGVQFFANQRAHIHGELSLFQVWGEDDGKWWEIMILGERDDLKLNLLHNFHYT